MMDNIQALIANRQYQGALEDRNETVRPHKPFKTPSLDQYNEFLEQIDLSLRSILDSPLGVFEFKRYTTKYDNFQSCVDFLVQYEKLKVDESTETVPAKGLMNLAYQLPSIYDKFVEKLRAEFKEHFGPISNFHSPTEPNSFLSKRVQSLEIESDTEELGEYEKFNSNGSEAFPDSTAPQSVTDQNYRISSLITPFGQDTTFGGFIHRKKAVKEAQESSVATELLSDADLKRISVKLGQNLNSPDTGEGDFQDRQVKIREKISEQKQSNKKQAVRIFGELADILYLKAEEFLQSFKGDSPEFKEMIQLMWYSEQQIGVDDFLMFRDLGRGAFGVVSAAKTKTTGTLTAIKCMNKKLIKGKKAKRLVVAEKAILEVLGDNPSNFTIWLKYSFEDKDYFYMAITLCTGGDLSYHLRKNHFFSVDRAMFTFAEILEGLDHLHSLKIVYRDLKPENVIFDAEGHARISDMGLAIQTGGRKIRGKAGTPGYWAPEVITNQPYSFSADHWSLGCVFYEMLTGICPFSSTNTRLADRNEGTLKWKVRFPKNHGKEANSTPFPPNAKSVILGLLNRDRSRRFGAEDVRKHEYFKGLDWYRLQTKQLRPPWQPSKKKINAPDQAVLDFESKDKNYKKIKLTEDDEIDNFSYISKYSHELDIVQVLNSKEKGNLEYISPPEESCCFCM